MKITRRTKHTAALAGLAGGALAGAVLGALAIRRRTSLAAPAPTGGPIQSHGVITVAGTPEQVYARWRDLPKLPDVLSHLHEVRVLDPQRSRWTAKGPEGRTVTWDVEITDDIPGQQLAWRSLPPAPAPTEGHVRFAPARGGRGTEVHLDLSYAPADGNNEVFLAAQERQIRRDLRRFKKAVER